MGDRLKAFGTLLNEQDQVVDLLQARADAIFKLRVNAIDFDEKLSVDGRVTRVVIDANDSEVGTLAILQRSGSQGETPFGE